MSYSKYAGREGEKFYRLTLLEGFKHNAYYKYKCLCDCGNVLDVYAHNLNEGAQRTTKSCGCYQREKVKQTMTKHGYNSGGVIKREYKTWHNMIQRCNNPKNSHYKDYGARGITVCQSWLSFENFISDMGDAPSEKHTLDRADNNIGYCKENCLWATRSEQGVNRRKQSSNTSGIVGVYYDKARSKYVARIHVNKQQINLGGYATIEEAKQARLDAEIKYFGRIIQR